ncbi:MAG: M14 family zinc carboxypeptidase [Actinomycetota bacterium]
MSDETTVRAPLTRRRFLQASAVAAAAATLPIASTARAGGGCDVFDTPAEFMGVVPSPEDVLGFDVGVDREVTTAESDAYLGAVAAASPRVITDSLGTSWQGRPIRYAILGKPSNVTPAGLASIRAATAKIRDPQTPDGEVAELAKTTPAILWIAANVHGSEESGTDASLQALYELADRDDCVVRNVLNNAIVVFVPVQNPDGRELDQRRNIYGFDLNRDTHVRTQPETDARVELMRRYPPLLFLDDHEFGFFRSFFPPNNDPQYQETDETVIEWIEDLYGAAFAAEFVERGWDFFNGSVYDFFAPQFGDTLGAMGFQGAGMTIEVYNGTTIERRSTKHLVIQWIAVTQAAANKERLLNELHLIFAKAVRQGEIGLLERNRRYFNPQRKPRMKVDRRPLRHYFFPPQADKQPELRRLIRRLQRMDVRVDRLDAPLQVPDFRAYGRDPAPRMLPAGTYWVPMAQPQKHWIQAMLNENTYMPTLFTFSLSGWSLPLLANLDGGMSGEELHPAASTAPAVAEPAPPGPPAGAPRIGLFLQSKGTFSYESYQGTRWLFDQRWDIPYTELRPVDVRDGALEDIDVLVTPGSGSTRGMKLLKPPGQRALVDWVNGGGRYVGYRGGGARLAALLGLSTARLHFPAADVPGTLLRSRVDPSSPLADTVGEFAWVLFDDDLIAKAGPSATPIVYPSADDDDWFASGYIDNPKAVATTAVCVDERAGSGRVVIFPADPNRRGMPEGMQRVLWNAIFGPDPAGGVAPRIGSAVRADAERRAREAAAALPNFDGPLRFSVASADADAAAKVVKGYGVALRRYGDGDTVRFLVDNPKELTVEEHPYAIELNAKLRKRGIGVRGFRGP